MHRGPRTNHGRKDGGREILRLRQPPLRMTDLQNVEIPAAGRAAARGCGTFEKKFAEAWITHAGPEHLANPARSARPLKSSMRRSRPPRPWASHALTKRKRSRAPTTMVRITPARRASTTGAKSFPWLPPNIPGQVSGRAQGQRRGTPARRSAPLLFERKVDALTLDEVERSRKAFQLK